MFSRLKEGKTLRSIYLDEIGIALFDDCQSAEELQIPRRIYALFHMRQEEKP